MTNATPDAALWVVLAIVIGLAWLGCLVVFVGTLFWAVRTIKKNRRRK